VTANGTTCGGVRAPPFHVDGTRALNAGIKRLEVEL